MLTCESIKALISLVKKRKCDDAEMKTAINKYAKESRKTYEIASREEETFTAFAEKGNKQRFYDIDIKVGLKEKKQINYKIYCHESQQTHSVEFEKVKYDSAGNVFILPFLSAFKYLFQFYIQLPIRF